MKLDKIILLTGATGFVGKSIASRLNSKELRVLGRTDPNVSGQIFYKADINGVADYSTYLRDVDVVIHSAARVHVMDDTSVDPQQAYNKVNTLGTLNLAKQAAAAGVKRFIFVSSVKVNGESTLAGHAFKNSDPAAPQDPYGISKAEAEKALRLLASETGMEVVIIRPPLVYGPGVKANFAAMLNIARKNLPLPLGAINNKRSLVSLDNLVDVIITCVDHPKAANQTFLVSDDRDVSTTELLQMMTRAVGKKPRLLPVPVSWLQFAGTITGKHAVMERLCGNLQLDIRFTKETLGWIPRITVEEGIKRCVE